MGSAHRYNDDPRRLREMLGKVTDLSRKHSLECVVVGLAGTEGDLLFPDIVDFVGSALRVEDSIFRMTRERALLFLADVDRAEAETVMERCLEAFRERFPTSRDPEVRVAYYEVTPDSGDLSVKELLPALFSFPPPGH